MQLSDFYDYKNRLMKDLLTHERIVHLINEEVPLDHAFEELAYKQVFPYEYIPETATSGHTFICCDVDVQSTPNKTFLVPALYIWIFAHRSRLRLPEGGVRTDALASEICKVINGSRYYSLGQLNIHSVKRFAPMTDYNGKVLTFYAKEFNRQYDGTLPVPSNRKEI